MIWDWARRATEAESENGVLGLAVEHWHQVADTLKQQRDQAEKERDALRKDAARLDWLEKHGVRTDWCDPENPDSVWVIFSDNRKDWDAAGGSSNGETLREAIDAAMEATP
jgi:hypothetical protein